MVNAVQEENNIFFSDEVLKFPEDPFILGNTA